MVVSERTRRFRVTLLWAGLSIVCCLTWVVNCNSDDKTNSSTDKREDEIINEESDEAVVENENESDKPESVPQQEEDANEPEAYIFLNDLTFDPFLKKNDIFFVEFFTDFESCPRCEMYLKPFSTAAKELKKHDPPIPFVRVDGPMNPKLTKRYLVAKYPTTLVFKNGQSFRFDGNRGSIAMVAYLKECLKPDWAPSKRKTIILNAANFTSYLSKKDIAFVKFYSEKDPISQQHILAEEELAGYFEEGFHGQIPNCKVDISASKSFIKTYNITRLPDFRVFRKGRAYEFRGKSAGTNDILEVLFKHQQPASTEVFSEGEIQKELDKVDPVVVGFFKNKKDELYEEYLEAGNYFRGFLKMLHTFNAKVAKHFKMKLGTIAIYYPHMLKTKYEDLIRKYTKKTKEKVDLEQFLKKHSVPLVGLRIHDNDQTVYADKPLVVVYYEIEFEPENRHDSRVIQDEIAKVAIDYPDIRFCISYDLEYDYELRELGLGDNVDDVNAAFYAADNRRYAMYPTEKFTADKLRKFIEDVLSGKHPPRVMSQPVPKARQNDPMKVVVANSFDLMVLKNPQNVLLALYSLNCPRCNVYMPVYESLAKNMANSKDVVISRMNIDSNEVFLPFRQLITPTIYFVPKNNKTHPILYREIDIDLEGLTKFTEKQIEAVEDQIKEAEKKKSQKQEL